MSDLKRRALEAARAAGHDAMTTPPRLVTIVLDRNHAESLARNLAVLNPPIWEVTTLYNMLRLALSNVTEVDSALAKLTQDNRELWSDLKAAQAALAEKDAEIDALSNAINAVNEDAVEAHTTLVERDAEIARLLDDIHDAQQSLVSARAEIAKLREQVGDWQDSAKKALDPCGDEKHCACVPLLRAQVEALREAREVWKHLADRYAENDEYSPQAWDKAEAADAKARACGALE